ncbi:hypothetical protein ABMC89_14285 [Sulfitobacter sp. HNIBRBA3233]|uniref:hypothetical protein n=1 Tax=Sulfitobacter marinivivus TaxID=3158558 RepID=UPI0032DFE359
MRGILGVAFCLALAGCGDPLSGVDRLSDVDVDQTDPAASVLPDAAEIEREGFFGTAAAAGGAETADPQAAAPAQAGGGFLSGLFGQRTAQTAEPAQVAALAPENNPADTAEDAPTGLAAIFGGGADAPRNGPDKLDVAYGTVLPFGEIARVCDAKGRNLGQRVDVASRRGFTLYDSVPGIVAKRTYYLTGFDDGCPRQFTAANALIGTPSSYEQFRFGPAGANMPYAATDAAYDKIKARECGSRKAKPCGSKIGKLDKQTAFVSAYEFNEHNGRWKEFLVHNGEVVEAALKSMN